MILGMVALLGRDERAGRLDRERFVRVGVIDLEGRVVDVEPLV
jgi:hypothetical protein